MSQDMDMRSYMETLSIISHEIKTPVNLIAATARIADMRLKNDSVSFEDIIKYFENIVNNCNKIELMLNNVMSVTTLSRNHFEIIDVNEFVEKFSSSIHDYCERLDFAFDTIVETTNNMINVPIAPVERILLNLITNAVKYNSKSEKNVTLKIFHKGKILCFSVKDNGDGIAKEEIPNVTKKFYRVPGSSESGMGLGLHLVQSLVSQLGGKLEIKSKLGKGTEVIFTIPEQVDMISLNASDYTYTPSSSTFDVEFSTLLANNME